MIDYDHDDNLQSLADIAAGCGDDDDDANDGDDDGVHGPDDH